MKIVWDFWIPTDSSDSPPPPPPTPLFFLKGKELNFDYLPQRRGCEKLKNGDGSMVPGGEIRNLYCWLKLWGNANGTGDSGDF